MLSRIATGTLFVFMAWIASCTIDTADRDIAPMSGDRGTKVVTAIPQQATSGATTTTTLSILVAVTTTSTTTTTLDLSNIGPAKPTIDEELRAIAEQLQSILISEYGYYTRSPEIVELQKILGITVADGIYGPRTRGLHIEHLGGPRAAIRLWYPPTWGQGLYEYYPHYLPSDEDPYGYGSGCHNRLPDPYTCERLPTLGDLINTYFLPEDRAWAFRVAFCESSGEPEDVFNEEISSALAVGWFQHLKKYWETGYRRGRAWDAGFGGYSIFDPIANVGVAAHLFYTSGDQHWNPSKSCWKDTPHA